jgi:hypothetical protein
MKISFKVTREIRILTYLWEGFYLNSCAHG